MSKNPHTYRKLLPNISKHNFRVHFKHYWHFLGVTPEKYYTLFKKLHNTDIFRVTTKQYRLIQSSYQTVVSLSELLPNNSKHFSEGLNGHLDRKFWNRKFPIKSEES